MSSTKKVLKNSNYCFKKKQNKECLYTISTESENTVLYQSILLHTQIAHSDNSDTFHKAKSSLNLLIQYLQCCKDKVSTLVYIGWGVPGTPLLPTSNTVDCLYGESKEKVLGNPNSMWFSFFKLNFRLKICILCNIIVFMLYSTCITRPQIYSDANRITEGILIINISQAHIKMFWIFYESTLLVQEKSAQFFICRLQSWWFCTLQKQDDVTCWGSSGTFISNYSSMLGEK